MPQLLFIAKDGGLENMFETTSSKDQCKSTKTLLPFQTLSLFEAGFSSLDRNQNESTENGRCGTPSPEVPLTSHYDELNLHKYK